MAKVFIFEIVDGKFALCQGFNSEDEAKREYAGRQSTGDDHAIQCVSMTVPSKPGTPIISIIET